MFICFGLIFSASEFIQLSSGFVIDISKILFAMASPAPSVSELSDVSLSELSTDEFLQKVAQIKDLETLDELKLDLLQKSQVIATKVCAVAERIEKLNPTSSVDDSKIVSVIVVVGENEHNTDVSKDWTVKQFRELCG